NGPPLPMLEGARARAARTASAGGDARGLADRRSRSILQSPWVAVGPGSFRHRSAGPPREPVARALRQADAGCGRRATAEACDRVYRRQFRAWRRAVVAASGGRRRGAGETGEAIGDWRSNRRDIRTLRVKTQSTCTETRALRGLRPSGGSPAKVRSPPFLRRSLFAQRVGKGSRRQCKSFRAQRSLLRHSGFAQAVVRPFAHLEEAWIAALGHLERLPCRDR